MGAYHWAKGIVGLWLSWVIITALATFNSLVVGVNDLIINETEAAGITIPTNFKDALGTINSWFASFWNFIALAVFSAFVFYIVVNSMRRDVVDEWYTS